MPNDNVLTARVADLLHLLEFAMIHTPTEGDGPQIIDAIRDIKAFLAAHPGQPEPRAEVTDDQTAAHELTDDEILEEYSKHVVVTYCGGVNVLSAMQPEGFIKGVRALLAAHPDRPEPRAEVTEEQPSLTNPLTPYGMLVRALRIVAGTTLMDMAQHLGRGPAELSAIEFGRKPVRDADIVDAAHFFACAGIQSTTHALTIAARSGGQHADQA